MDSIPPFIVIHRGNYSYCSQKKLADPRERLKSESEGIVLSPQRRSFNSGCQVTQTASKDDVHERGTHDKGNRPVERDPDGLARDRNSRDSRGNDLRGDRSMYNDRVLDKEDLPMSLREGRRRDGANDDDRGRRVGSGRIPPNRGDRERGLSGDDYGVNERTRNERMRDQNPLDRTHSGDNRDRGMAERRGVVTTDRREMGREDNRDPLNNGRSRFGFQRERDLDGPRERLRRDMDQNDADFDRSRVRDLRGGDWNDAKIKECEPKRERIPANQYNYPSVDRQHPRNERRDERNLEPERGDQRYKPGFSSAEDNNKFPHNGEGGYNQRYQGFGYGRRDRGGSRYHQRRSETEEPEWMSESVQLGELMELRGFDDSPEKEVFSHSSSVGKYYFKRALAILTIHF